jgi:hypothetical protein
MIMCHNVRLKTSNPLCIFTVTSFHIGMCVGCRWCWHCHWPGNIRLQDHASVWCEVGEAHQLARFLPGACHCHHCRRCLPLRYVLCVSPGILLSRHRKSIICMYVMCISGNPCIQTQEIHYMYVCIWGVGHVTWLPAAVAEGKTVGTFWKPSLTGIVLGFVRSEVGKKDTSLWKFLPTGIEPGFMRGLKGVLCFFGDRSPRVHHPGPDRSHPGNWSI